MEATSRKRGNALQALGRGVSAVLLVRSALSLLTGMTRGRSLGNTLRVILSRDTARQAGFIGVYSGLFTAISNWLRDNTDTTPGGVDAIAGALAGVSILLDDPMRRGGLAQYLLSRAVALGCVSGCRRGILPTVPRFAAWIFALSEIPIMTGFMFYPEAMNPDYLRLVTKWSRDYTHERLTHVIRNPPLVDKFLSCEAAGHHDGPCLHYLCDGFRQDWLATAKMYLPLYCIPRVTFSLGRTLKNPQSTVKKTVLDITYSGLMLATYILALKISLCSFRNITQWKGGRMPVAVGIIGGLMSGSGVLWESEGRQRELAIYVVPQALTIVWNIMRMKRLVKPIPGADVAMFAAAMSSIMYHLGAFRSDVKPFVRNPLERVVFGPLIPAAGKKTKPSEGEAPRPPKAAVRQD